MMIQGESNFDSNLNLLEKKSNISKSIEADQVELIRPDEPVKKTDRPKSSNQVSGKEKVETDPIKDIENLLKEIEGEVKKEAADYAEDKGGDLANLKYKIGKRRLSSGEIFPHISLCKERNFTDGELSQLKNLEMVKSIYMSVPLTKKISGYLSELYDLERLSVYGKGLSEEVLGSLREVRSLRHLSIIGGKDISQKTLDELYLALPGIEIKIKE